LANEFDTQQETVFPKILSGIFSAREFLCAITHSPNMTIEWHHILHN